MLGLIALCVPLRTARAADEQLGEKAMLALLGDDPEGMKRVLDAGLSLQWCPTMKDVPFSGGGGFNKQLNQAKGYSFIYWVAAFGSERLKSLFRAKGIAIAGEPSASALENALLARFELVHLGIAYEMIWVEHSGFTENSTPAISEIHFWLRGFAQRWSGKPRKEFMVRSVPRATTTALRDPFGNAYLIQACGTGPKLDPRSAAAAESALGVSSVEFWGEYLVGQPGGMALVGKSK